MGSFGTEISKAVIVGLMLFSLKSMEKMSAFFEIMFFNGSKARLGRIAHDN